MRSPCDTALHFGGGGMNPFDTLTIDYDSPPGSWKDALKYSVNIRVVSHDVDDVTDGECHFHGNRADGA